uniref:Omega-hydroxypalmitate O-feruloyl transferase n=1 Tax=Ananas comosus var. bracteatus TaxID=296719 RepID=A0A6V7QHB2_ANACO|nr:unnamed protein product [Ananas comosus var. bracteatus]
MELSCLIVDLDVKREAPITLLSPENPTPIETVCLSNIDQTVAFPVETIFFYDAPPVKTLDIVEILKRSVSDVLLIPYYFMAGRLDFNVETKRLELLCNNAGILFASATSRLKLEELGNLSLPNPSFRHLILQTDGFKSLRETPVFTIQVTRFKCGGFSIGFVTNHSIMDGRSAAEMFENLAAICRGEGMKYKNLNNDRSCIKARDPPRIMFDHPEYTKLAEYTTSFSTSSSSFTSPLQSTPPISLSKPLKNNIFEMLSFTSDMIECLKEKATNKCSTFESHCCSPLDIKNKSTSFHELDFGCGKPVYGGPVVSGMDEFVLLLSGGNGMGMRGGISVSIALEQEKMEKFLSHVFDYM